MTAQCMEAGSDDFPRSHRTAVSARKSDTFLHTKLGRSETIHDERFVPTRVSYEVVKENATSPDVLLDRLRRVFSDRVSPRERRSMDVVNAVGHTQRSGSGSISVHNFPLKQVPHRKSSLITSRQTNLQDFPSWRLPPPAAAGKLIIDRGRAESPVRRSIAQDSVSSDALRLSPSRTFVRPTPPVLLLQSGNIPSKRIELSVDLNAPIFVGGGTIEGKVNIYVDRHHYDQTKKKDLLVSKLSIDVVGQESMANGRDWVFLALACEVFDERHPPPPTIAASRQPAIGPELFWTTKPGHAAVPFRVNLPLNIGPPPYSSRHASIRYTLLATLVVKSGDKKAVVSRVCEVRMHTVYDPYKALASLPSPMIAAEALNLTRLPGPQSVKLSAGLHRQIWISGSSIFVDVHIVNKSDRCLKKFGIELQRSLLWYDHAAAGTGDKNASHLRIPKRQDSEIVSATVVKKSKQWKGVLPRSSEVRTCQIDVPRGQVTVSTGRFFEVRYFLNVIVTVTILKTVSVQLPVTLIHMSSLDIVPNALAQVAASIEAKRSKTLPLESNDVLYLPYHQGQAFIASRNRSLEQTRTGGDPADKNLEGLRRRSDQSPRKYQHHHCRFHSSKLVDLPSRPSLASQTSQHRLDLDCYHCHLIHEKNRRPSTSHSRSGGNLPRLRVSTSGLGFTDTEFSVRDSPPRKVMLSERERKMINQQRELEKRQEWQKMKQLGSQKHEQNAAKQPTVSQPLPNMDAKTRLNEQMKRAEPHIMVKAGINRKRSKTFEVSPLIQSQTHPSATVQGALKLQTTLRSSDAGAKPATPQGVRRRAYTGSDSLSKPVPKIGPDHLHKGVTFPQDTVTLQRMSSKQRGKLPVRDFVFQEKELCSRPGS